MAVTLTLKRRPVKNTVLVPIDLLKSVLEGGDREALWRFMNAPEVRDAEGYIHDSRWLSEIVNWVPEGKRASLTDVAPWLKLAQRVAQLADVDGKTFTLSVGQAKLIWDRLNLPDYKVQALPPLFVEFLMDFMQAAGTHFATLTDELMFDE